MRVLIVFFTLALASVGSLFWLVHGRPAILDKASDLAPPKTLTEKKPDWADLPLEPARPVGSDLHKCVAAGSVTYTDQPCAKGQTRKKLDPERSRIVTVPGPKSEAGSATARPAPLQAGEPH
ncbi:hypothetical protein [Niveibacterium terrae]|uniref:hypothetical protein n=1 Tax=Niveibacterium terrae TaxID=3373598 RepID=UPI003A900A58